MNIEDKNFCGSCFAEIPESDIPCPVCGYKDGDESKYPTALPVGSILLGRYIIGKALGKGGFGVTYLAFDSRDVKKVAVKEYLPDTLIHRNTGDTLVSTFQGDKEEAFKKGTERFYEEAQTISRFNGHPNIVGVYEFFYENSAAYFVMEFLEGVDLKSYVARQGGTLTEQQLLKIVLPLIDALIIVHSVGVLHRDISPDNIYITNDGKIKLLDFGAARQVMGEESKSLSVVLKQGFAPIEQYQTRGKQGPWTDIYALGATMFYCLTGKVPLSATDRLNNEELDGGCPAGLAEILQKMMAVNAISRYQSVIELKGDIESYFSLPAEMKNSVSGLGADIRFQNKSGAVQSQGQSDNSAPQSETAPANARLETNESGVPPVKKGVSAFFARRKKFSLPVLIGTVACAAIIYIIIGVTGILKPDHTPAGGGNNVSKSIISRTVSANTSSSTPEVSSGQASDDVSQSGFTPDYEPNEKNKSGNTNANIINGGNVAIQGKWIYYCNTSYEGELYKIKNDGTGKTKLNSDFSVNINVVGDWIYYSSISDNFNMYKIRTDGTGRKKITSDESKYIHVIDDWIYYSNSDDNDTIYKIKTDGTGRTKLSQETSYLSYGFNLVGDWIYYNRGQTRRVRTDGKNDTVLAEESSFCINVIDDWIYCATLNGIIKLKTDGTGKTTVTKDLSHYINVSEGWIYYSSADEDGKLFRIKVDGTAKMELSPEVTMNISIAGNWVYYENGSGDLYRVRDNGTSNQPVS